MIAFLAGRLLEKHANTAIVDVGGVGYEVSIPLTTFYELGEVGTEVELRIYTHVREDAIQLFGFKSLRERDLYLRLISVQGIGPKSGIAMLSGLSADEIIAAIRSNNLARLTSIPGVGQKTAERVVIELRDKVSKLSAVDSSLDKRAKSGETADDAFEDALSALVNLGYQRNAAEKALQQAGSEGTEISSRGFVHKKRNHRLTHRLKRALPVALTIQKRLSNARWWHRSFERHKRIKLVARDVVERLTAVGMGLHLVSESQNFILQLFIL